MIKFHKLPDNISKLIPQSVEYFNYYDRIIFAYLFGSMVEGDAKPLSDIDIAIYLQNDDAMDEGKIEILSKLIDILETDEIDLVILNKAPLPLEIKILEKKKVLVDKNPFLRHRYESIVIRKYLDFSIMESNIMQRRFLDG